MNETQFSETRWKGLFRIVGILTIVLGIAWIAVTRLTSTLHASGQPNTALGYLRVFSQNQALAASAWILWIIADVLLIPVTISLYLVLRHVSKSLAVAGAIFALAFCIYDPLVTELQSLRLVSFSQAYAVATTEAVKVSIVANATIIVNALPLMTFLSFFIGSVGTFLFSIAMTKSAFGKALGAFGIITNMTAIIGSLYPLLSNPPYIIALFFIISVPLVALWFISIGVIMLQKRNQFQAIAVNPRSGLEISKLFFTGKLGLESPIDSGLTTQM
jgi:hypothetical protein